MDQTGTEATAPCVLIVEDNDLNLKLFCDLLRAHGYRVEGIKDGREVMARALAIVPNLVVMDIQLPHVSGLELIQQMRAEPWLSTVPIMAVTAYAAAGDEQRIRQAGADAYVPKPVTVKSFLSVVRSLL